MNIWCDKYVLIPSTNLFINDTSVIRNIDNIRNDALSDKLLLDQ